MDMKELNEMLRLGHFSVNEREQIDRVLDHLDGRHSVPYGPCFFAFVLLVIYGVLGFAIYATKPPLFVMLLFSILLIGAPIVLSEMCLSSLSVDAEKVCRKSLFKWSTWQLTRGEIAEIVYAVGPKHESFSVKDTAGKNHTIYLYAGLKKKLMEIVPKRQQWGLW